MKYIKFTTVKLIIINITLICSIHLILGKHAAAKEIFTIQIAATKTPVNILEFSKKHKITDSIIVVKSEYWNRYYIGDFDTYELASAYAKELAKKTTSKEFSCYPN